MAYREYNLKTMVPGIVVSLAVILTLIIVFALNKTTPAKAKDAQEKLMSQYTEQLNARNADIIFYKKDPNGPAGLKARRVNALNDRGLALNLYESASSHVLIFNDLDGSLTLSDQDIQKIKELQKVNKFRIVYLGKAQYKRLVSEEILLRKNADKEEALSHIAFYNKNMARSGADGFADKSTSMPVTSGLTDEQKLIYTVIAELARKDLYFT